MNEGNGKAVTYKVVVGVLATATLGMAGTWGIDVNSRLKGLESRQIEYTATLSTIAARQGDVLDTLKEIKEGNRLTAEKLDRNFEMLVKHTAASAIEKGKSE